MLLIATSLVISRSTQSLIAGESAAPALLTLMREAIDASTIASKVARVRTLMLGPRSILVALTLAPDSSGKEADLEDELSDVTKRLVAVDERVAHVLFEFDEGEGG